MGIFADTCRALIDPATGRALRGEALEAAKKDPKAKRCGHTVKKAARFCSKCGSGAPGGWWQCPACGKWVGNESNFCWNCDKPMNLERRTGLSGGVWQKSAEVFAEKFDAGDVKRLLKEGGLVIEAGTAAILTDAGRFKDVLLPGRYNLDGLARRINNWGDPPPRTVVLVENGDVVLPLRIDGLRSADSLPVEFYTEVAFHFVEKGAPAFLDNLFKNREHLSQKEIADVLGREIVYAVQNVCNTSNMEDLVKDPQRRTRLEDELNAVLGKTLDRYGLEIVRVPSVEFTGKEYEELAQKAGEAEIKRRELEFAQRMRELVSSDKMHQFKTEHELDEYVAQLAQERGVGQEQRSQELALLRLVHRQEIDAKAAEFAMVQEMARKSHEIQLDKMGAEYDREKEMLETQNATAIAKMWLAVKAEKQRVERENEAARANMLEGVSLQTIIALTDDPEKREDLIKLNAQLMQKGQSADAILAAQAAYNPELARVVLEMQRTKREDRDKDWEERKKLLDDGAERMERILKSALDNMATAAKQGPGATIVK